MARVKKNVIEIRNILFQLKKDLSDTELFFREISDSSILSAKSSEIASVSSPLMDREKSQKLMYMTIALTCSYWEGTISKIKSVRGIGINTFNQIYANPKRSKHLPWFNQDMHFVGNIRNCIAHHNGQIRLYKNYIKNKFGKNIRPFKKIPKKYHYYDPANKDLKLQLKPEDMKDFFTTANKVIDHILRDFSRLYP